MDGWAAHPMGWGGDGVVASPVEAPGVSLIARRCLSGATPRGQSWTSAGLLPHGRNGLNAQRMAVVSTFREPSLCRHVPRALWRSVWLDLPPIIAVTACHQRNCVERYSRFRLLRKADPRSPRLPPCATSCAMSCKGRVGKPSLTPSSGRLPPGASGSIALPAKARRLESIARALDARLTSPASWNSTSIASSIKTPCSMAPSIPNGVAAHWPRCWPNRPGSNSAVSASAAP